MVSRIFQKHQKSYFTSSEGLPRLGGVQRTSCEDRLTLRFQNHCQHIDVEKFSKIAIFRRWVVPYWNFPNTWLQKARNWLLSIVWQHSRHQKCSPRPYLPSALTRRIIQCEQADISKHFEKSHIIFRFLVEDCRKVPTTVRWPKIWLFFRDVEISEKMSYDSKWKCKTHLHTMNFHWNKKIRSITWMLVDILSILQKCPL